jgi:hypothetical protein
MRRLTYIPLRPEEKKIYITEARGEEIYTTEEMEKEICTVYPTEDKRSIEVPLKKEDSKNGNIYLRTKHRRK